MVYAKTRPFLIQPDDASIRYIALTRGQVAIVDAERYGWAMGWHWYAAYNCYTKSFYAARRENKSHVVFLHRQLLGEPEDLLVDHKNGATLDNRISNLRTCTQAQNNANRGPAAKNASGYPGVDWYEPRSSWRAKIRVNGRTIHIGYFDFASVAITARELAEEKYFGEFAFSKRSFEPCPCPACQRNGKRPCEAARPVVEGVA